MDFETGYTMTIGGRPASGDGTIDVVNPADGDVFAQAPRATAADLDAAVVAARAAFPAWRDTPIVERRRILSEAAQRIGEHAEALGRLFTREQGRPLPLAIQEVKGGAWWLRATTKLDLPVEVTEDSETRRIEVHHVPLGVVCAIVPWNFPVLLAMWKIAPALLAGNTMVLKPSPFTPLCMLKIGELLRGLVPDGVLNIVTGGDELGPMMTSHPGFAKISFTGSTATGKRVMESAAKDLKRVTLELGGNDAAIVMPDIDLDAVVEQIFHGAFYNSAQVCIATKRMYIHEDIYDALRDRLHEIARRVTVGDGAAPGTDYGPIQNKPQHDRVMALIDEAKASGLTLLQGKEVPAKGYFVPITIVDNPPEDAHVVTEEAFGPILPLLKFRDIDDVIARANDSDYGLGGAVWSRDINKAVEIARRMDTGTIWINQNLQNTPFTPFAGAKQSGIGVENGAAGLLEFTQPRTIFIPKAAIA
ncbi:aldehyde dehydrogenase family protein [Sphingomonas sp. CGMCC 1.13654]|uniref:Aldehyde dehydrogenase family protein n=1 Tax=Sphingomonas chungangi TaxID=2683589 RepID=A0A838L341_9SPHN|nr:aldehyde dehydrogenase family protein [Sphingomonas chungangi]MBA2933811.1 aldehyde dehydrogenase family protein [Sphingomonas chungangi]MVW55141.1 aldehyde dehydrogenase family protein [Sphingomonas chungangi]